MSCECDKNSFVLLRGYSSRWDGVDWLSISFSSETQVDFTGFSAKFKIGQYIFENNDLTQPWIINLTDEQTATLPLGMNTGSLIVYDTEGEGKPFTTSIPVLVKDWVDGDVEIDTYKATILATLDNQNEFIVNVETAKVSLEWVDEKISEHNNSNLSHPYILGLIDDEKQARINVDNQLIDRIDSISGDLSNYRTAAQQDIIDNNQNEAIASKQNKLSQSQLNAVNSGITSQKVSSYDNHIANTTIHVTSQEKQTWNNKQNAIQDLDTIRSNALAGKNASDTISGYGDIVTHNVSEFATSAQGDLADTALQPTDVIDNTSSSDTDKPLSANMGKSLQDQVDNLKARGRFLALWNCATGLAESNPPSGTYTYQAGDYFIVGVVAQAGQNNYKPDGSTYTTGVASTVIETQPVDTDDVYYYDGHVWHLQVNTQKEIGFINLAGSPYDNTALAAALNNKQNTIADLSEIRSGSSAGATALQPSALNGYATETWVGQQGYLTSTALVGYATQQWVESKGYLTSADLNGYATQVWVGQQGFLTSTALSGYATQQWVENQGYLPIAGGNITGNLSIKTGFHVGDTSAPDGYDLVDYAEITSSYLDTGYIGNQNSEYRIKYSYVGMTGGQAYPAILGNRANTNAQIALSPALKVGGAGNSNNRWGTTAVSWTTQNGITAGKTYFSVMNRTSLITTSEDDTSTLPTILFNNTQTFSTSGTITLGWIRGTSFYSRIKIYSFVIAESGSIVKNFVPVKRKSDNKFGLYDYVTGAFITGSVSGPSSVQAPIYTVFSGASNKLLFKSNGDIELESSPNVDDISNKVATTQVIHQIINAEVDKINSTKYDKVGGNISGDMSVKDYASFGNGIIPSVDGYELYDYLETYNTSSYLTIPGSIYSVYNRDNGVIYIDGQITSFGGNSASLTHAQDLNIKINKISSSGEYSASEVSRFWSFTYPIIGCMDGSDFIISLNNGVFNFTWSNGTNSGSNSFSIEKNVPQADTGFTLGGSSYNRIRIRQIRLGNNGISGLTKLDAFLVPAKRISDNAVGMYDLVRKIFYVASLSSVGGGASQVNASFFSGTNAKVDYYIGSNNTPSIGFDGITSQASLLITPSSTASGKELVNAEWVTNQGYLTSISSSDVTNALGYTPYNTSNPAGYITSAALNGYATEQYVDNIVGDIETILHNINSGS